jgi:NADP-dependent 3-hydroxy acid dehydrogenase YdfG
VSRRRPPAHPLPGRVVAITGAGRGIGLTTARRLLARGARVALGDLDGDLARAAAADAPNAVGLELDVCDPGSFAAFLAAAERELGPVDVLVNNAGIMPIGPFLDEPDALTRRQVDVNVHGVVTGMKLAAPGMVRRGRGHLVNVGSAASLVGLAGEAVYCGTKHFVLGVSEGVRTELLGTGVEVSVVMPNLVATELGSGMSTARGSKLLAPDDVADAIVACIERPRFEVPVPRDVGFQLKVRRLLPVRVRDLITRALAMDRIATDPDEAERRAYAERMEADAGRAA